MKKDPWLPQGYKINSDTQVKKLKYFGDKWQIYSATDEKRTVIVEQSIADKWLTEDLLNNNQLIKIQYGEKIFKALNVSGEGFVFPLQDSMSPETKTDAMAFATALKRTRKLLPNITLHDAIYVEKYSVLLPTYSITESCDDAMLLGTWLTGGVQISTRSFNRLVSFSSWLNKQEIADIVMAAGLDVPNEYNTDKEKVKKDVAADKMLKGISKDAKANVFTLHGRPKLEKFFNEHIIDIVLHTEKYSRLGIEFPSATILYGPPGCGKTYAAERLVEFLDWPSYTIDSNSIGSPYIHATSKKIAEIFTKAIDNAPSVLLIDEMEAYVSNRFMGGESGTHHVEEVAEFLRRIPEAIAHRVLIIAMTNHLDMIDPAIRRRGRFDNLIEVGMPSRVEVEVLIASLLSKIPTAEQLDTKKIILEMTGKPLSDSAYLIREAARIAAKNGKDMVDQESIDMVLSEILKNNKEKKNEPKIGF